MNGRGAWVVSDDIFFSLSLVPLLILPQWSKFNRIQYVSQDSEVFGYYNNLISFCHKKNVFSFCLPQSLFDKNPQLSDRIFLWNSRKQIVPSMLTSQHHRCPTLPLWIHAFYSDEFQNHFNFFATKKISSNFWILYFMYTQDSRIFCWFFSSSFFLLLLLLFRVCLLLVIFEYKTLNNKKNYFFLTFRLHHIFQLIMNSNREKKIKHQPANVALDRFVCFNYFIKKQSKYWWFS